MSMNERYGPKPHEICLRCGKCCHYISPITNKLKRCKYMKQLTDGSFYCRVYMKRTRTVITIEKNRKAGVICVQRKDDAFDYRGCPYNTDKPYFEDYVKDETRN